MSNKKRFRKKLQAINLKPPGTPPGTIEYVGPVWKFTPRAEMICYSENAIRVDNLVSCCPVRTPGEVCWVRVRGLHNPEIIRQVGESFKLPSMLLEDALNTSQRSKLEEHDEGLFLVFKVFSYNAETEDLQTDQVSLFLGDDFVVSLAETENDSFDQIMQRLQKGKSRLRKSGADYLMLMLLDEIIDSYFVVLETLGGKLENLEEEVLGEDIEAEVSGIYRLRRTMIHLGRALRPLREIVSILRKSDMGYIADDNLVYARDIFDHGIQVVDTVEDYRDILAGMLEIVMTNASMRMNAIMKTLTSVSTIFMPLTFIAGVYGMNFQYMPELHWHYGYFLAMGLMALVGIGMYISFQRRKWL